MATSGSVNWFANRDEIITAAAQEIGELAEGETLSTERKAAYVLRLNSWTKSLMATGAKLWAMEQATLFLTVGTASYSLGATGTHCTNTYIQTTLSAAAAISATSLSLTSTSGMAASDNIGIVLDDGTIHWTTISGAPGAPTTIADGLASAATSGNIVFTYTTKINRPNRIDPDGIYRSNSSGYDTPVSAISRTEYSSQTNKVAKGKIIDVFYDRQLVNGVLYVWPTPDTATDVLKFWYERIIEDFDVAADTPDFATEWTEALILGLAAKMAPSASVTPQVLRDVTNHAAAALQLAMNYDSENVSVFFEPRLE